MIEPTSTPIPSAKPIAIAPNVAKCAVEWLIQWQSADDAELTWQQILQWRQLNAEHEKAWLHIEKMNEKFGLFSANQHSYIAHNTLASTLPHNLQDNLPSSAEKAKGYDLSSRRDAIKLLSAFFVVGSSSWLANQQKPWQKWLADYQTDIGEQQQITLLDGSKVTLNTNTAININYTDTACNITLIKGELYVKSAEKSTRKQTLIVHVAQGQVQPIGTRFTVRQTANESHVAVFDGAVKIKPLNNTEGVILNAGNRLYFTDKKWSVKSAASESQAAWTQGMIVVSNMSLNDFLLELNRYRYGVIQCDPAIGQLKISGTYPINHAEHVLQTLTYALPIKLQFYTQYWVRVLPKDEA